MKVKLFDTEINMGNYYCKLNNDNADKIESPYLNLYIQSKFCNADCDFCEYKDIGNNFNLYKFEDFLIKLNEQIEIRKISFTGGEPTLNYKEFVKRVKIARKILPNTFFVVNTNGIHLKKIIEDGIIEYFDSIALSRHSYDDDLNNDILKFNAPSTDELKTLLVGYEHIIHFSCNIIKDYIDSEQEVYNYLDWCSSVGCSDVGFVSLMTINEYTKKHFIDFDTFKFNNIRFNKTKDWDSENKGCKCSNYLYIDKNLKPIKIYNRFVYSKSIGNNFVFDGENFKQGFNGKNIY